ncbi:MAG TPA: MogA/MoaB family molybdenum cofactor biosynthesis protein [Acidimicrobiales bacterium]|nr:MogA/MoaB family molybdenum cofactor biosynthesis protein [Acidimicrobiales bacterium]
MAHQAKVLTVSDSVAHGHTEDRGGIVVAELLKEHGFIVVERCVSEDGVDAVANALARLAGGFVGLVVTTGGTGFGPRDLTPEGTRAVIDREAPGISEAMRLINPLGRLSRSVAGTIGQTLVLNTPGSPKGAIECLGAVLDIIPHALDLLGGENPHPHGRAAKETARE